MLMTYLKTLISKNSTILERWTGGQARMLELTRSHATLTVVVDGEEYGRNLVLACLEPKYVCGPVSWSDSAIELKVTRLDDGSDGIAVIDDKNGVRITAESIEIKENVKL